MTKKRKLEEEERQQQQEEGEGTVAPRAFAAIRPRLSDGVLAYVRVQGFTQMTPVQAATIPLFLDNKDVAVQAVTGSGKTLAFLIPCVEYLQRKTYKPNQVAALILSPTRELAMQSFAVAVEICESCGLRKPLLLVGGGSSGGSGVNHRPVSTDLHAFAQQGSDIVIGTPGRVEDILTKYAAMDCSELDCLILDEADVLLGMGFATSLQNILSKLPKMRRTGLFSATTSSSSTSSLKEWMKNVGMRNPVWIDVAVTPATEDIKNNSQSTATPSTLTNYYVVAPLEEKLSRLVAFLRQHQQEKVIVFFLTCACVDFFGTALQQLLCETNIALLHGKMVQKRREKTMEGFKGGSSRVLFCTDVAARGIDVSGVHWVVQYDAPQDPSFFVHRVGRSARAGRTGQSLLFLTHKEEAYVDLLRMRKVPLSPISDKEDCSSPCGSDKTGDSSVQSNSTVASPTSGPKSIPNMLPYVTNLVVQDRDLLEKGTKAFVSYVRAYKEHHCAFIFRFASLDLGRLANSFCLLRLPKMPEIGAALKNGVLPHFSPRLDVTVSEIAFRDKAREKARQARLLVSPSVSKWEKAAEKKAAKEKKQEARRQAAKAKGRNPDKKRGKHQRMMDEWDELAKEERLYKKLRSGKISKDEYDRQMEEVV